MGMRSEFRNAVVAYLNDQADWRDRKAAEYPEDARNARSAAALRELAGYVETLPDDDDKLAALMEVQERYDLDVFAPDEEAARMISRVGFDAPMTEPEAFLAALVTAEVKDTVGQEHDEGGEA
jgi:hypothetical protein